MKRRALERHLRQHGAEAIEEGARHTKWRGPTGGQSVVPRHAEIGSGVAIATLQAARRTATAESALSAFARAAAQRLSAGEG